MGFWSRFATGVGQGFQSGAQIGAQSAMGQFQAEQTLGRENRQRYGEAAAELAGQTTAAQTALGQVDLSTPGGRSAAAANEQTFAPALTGGAARLAAMPGAPAGPVASTQPMSTEVATPPQLPGIAALPGAAQPGAVTPGMTQVAGQWMDVGGKRREIEQAYSQIDAMAPDNTAALENYRQRLIASGVAEDKADTAIVVAQRGIQRDRDDFIRANIEGLSADAAEALVLQYGGGQQLRGYTQFVIAAKRLQEKRTTQEFDVGMQNAQMAQRNAQIEKARKVTQDAMLALNMAGTLASFDLPQAQRLYDSGVVAQVEQYNPQLAAILASSRDAYLGANTTKTADDIKADMFKLLGDPSGEGNTALVRMGSVLGIPNWPTADATGNSPQLTGEQYSDLEKAVNKHFKVYDAAPRVDAAVAKYTASITSTKDPAARETAISRVLAEIQEDPELGPEVGARLQKAGLLDPPQIVNPQQGLAAPGENSGLGAVLPQTPALPGAAPAPVAAPKPAGLSAILGGPGAASPEVTSAVDSIYQTMIGKLSPEGVQKLRPQIEKLMQDNLRVLGDVNAARRETARQFRLAQ